MKVKETLCKEFNDPMTDTEYQEYEFYLIYVEGYPCLDQILDKECEDEMLLQKIAEYHGGFVDEYVLKN